MFGISFGELFVIGLVGLVVLGPEKLPVVARTLGRLMRQVQSYTNAFKDELNRELHNAEILELEKELSAEGRKLKAELTQDTPFQEVGAEINEIQEELQDKWHAGPQLPHEDVRSNTAAEDTTAPTVELEPVPKTPSV